MLLEYHFVIELFSHGRNHGGYGVYGTNGITIPTIA